MENSPEMMESAESVEIFSLIFSPTLPFFLFSGLRGKIIEK